MVYVSGCIAARGYYHHHKGSHGKCRYSKFMCVEIKEIART